MNNLEVFVSFRNTEDDMIYPSESSHFRYYNKTDKLVSLEESVMYQRNLLNLKTNLGKTIFLLDAGTKHLWTTVSSRFVAQYALNPKYSNFNHFNKYK